MMEWDNNQQQQPNNQNSSNLQGIDVSGGGSSSGGMYVKVMTDEQLETLRKQIAIYATICDRLVEMHKTLTSQQDLAGCLRWIIHMKQDNPVVLELSVKWFLCFDTKSEASKESCSESVIIMPTFGIQLETQYLSGKTVSRFIPIGKILKPVLVECVTPITCYSSLSLFLRGEKQLTLVFKELRPPLKMLVPILKELCAVIGTDQSEMITDEKHDASG
ncbi:hypothetical protein F2Q69_00032823 [Brassica cretica]|uniref:Phosphatidylinositol N-acetylglucosaminyltransferase subunit H conserved domain-containing protein n=1 Tax=Brassica cretica TaxID=69181 RepID=A0A8S9SNI8_BRACR|nr:hypothetical protein F2Q69_00032823 [Brassica cretica]